MIEQLPKSQLKQLKREWEDAYLYTADEMTTSYLTKMYYTTFPGLHHVHEDAYIFTRITSLMIKSKGVK